MFFINCSMSLISFFELLVFNLDKSIGKELIFNPLPDDLLLPSLLCFSISAASSLNIIFLNH